MNYLTRFKSLSRKQQLNILLFITGILIVNFLLSGVISFLIQIINPQVDFKFIYFLVGSLIAASSSIVCFYLGFKK